MVLKIHGVQLSTCTQPIMTVLKELNVPHEIVPVDFAKMEHKSDEYIKTKQPFGKIPVLEEEDGFKLFESRAISRYITTKYGNGKLVPKGVREVALFEQAASIEQNNFYPYVSGIVSELYFSKMRGVEGDKDRAAKLQKDLEASLKGYEIILSKQDYLAGNEFTLADIFHLAYGWILTEKLKIPLLKSTETPHVAKWWARISERDSWKAVQAEVAELEASRK